MIVLIGEPQYAGAVGAALSSEEDIKTITKYSTKDTLQETLGVIELDNTDTVILFSYGRILSGVELNYNQYQIHNIHPSPLPMYRGADPIGAQILDGIRQSVVTLQEVEERVDRGRILTTMPYVIGENLIEQTAQMIRNYYLTPEPAMTKKFTKKDAIYSDQIIHVGSWLKYLKFHDTHPRFIIDGKLIIVEGERMPLNCGKKMGFNIQGQSLYLVARNRNLTIKVSSIQVEGKKKQSATQYINQLRSRL